MIFVWLSLVMLLYPLEASHHVVRKLRLHAEATIGVLVHSLS